MDSNPIDIKIKEFALYLKNFGLLNETNINDFLKKFKNISDKSLLSSGNFETDVNVGLIYLKENLSKTMLEYYDLMTEERKKITYLNIYSKFVQKRENDLQNKGEKIYSLSTSLIIKKYFNNWKMHNKSEKTNIYKNKENKYKNSNDMTRFYKKDNFCFDIISNNNEDYNKNNVMINSNNNKIIFNTNSSTKFNINNYNNSSINSNNNINSFLLSSQSRLSEKNMNKEIDINQIYCKPQINKENVLDRLIYQNKINKEEGYNLYNSSNKSYDLMRHSAGPKKRISNIKQNNNIQMRKTFNKYKEKKELKFTPEKFRIPSQKVRNTYNCPSRPKSSLHYNENKSKNNVYERLYEQNKEKIKRQEERIKENINEIKQRASHPIQKKNKINNFRNFKKNQNLKNNNNSHNNNIYNNKFKIKYDGENLIDKQYVSKKIDEVLFEKSFKGKTRYQNNSVNLNQKININLDDEQERKDGQNFIENQRKCIELFNDMIDKEEKKGGKIFNENEKEKIFKDLLNKMYKENQNDKVINKENNIREDEKVDEHNIYNSVCQSVDIKLK